MKISSRFSGLKKSYFVERRIRIHPQPKKDEIFTSWFSRVAIANNSIPHSFASVYFGNYLNHFVNDPDWGTLEFYQEVANKVSFPLERILNLSLRSYEGYLFEDVGEFNNSKPFINPVKPVGGTFRKHGMRYCPLCLTEDNYFRKVWRVTFFTACPVHGVFLLDRCQECGSPVTPHKWRSEVNYFHCYRCGFDFRKAVPEAVPQGSYGLVAIENFLKILNDGYFFFNNRPYYSIGYFKVVKHLVTVIYFMKKRNSQYLKVEEDLLGIRLSDKIGAKFYYDIPLKEQYIIFSAVERILQSVEELERFIKDNKLKKTELTRDFEDYPFWYEEIARDHDETYYKITPEELLEAIKYLQKNNIPVHLKNLRQILGRGLYLRKRQDLKAIIYRASKAI